MTQKTSHIKILADKIKNINPNNPLLTTMRRKYKELQGETNDTVRLSHVSKESDAEHPSTP